MSASLTVCEVDEDLKAILKKFRFRKETNDAAILIKIDMEKQLVILEQELQDISLDELREELPNSQPSSPPGCKPEQQMMYAGSKLELVKAAGLTKVFETRNADDLTEEWLKERLSMFR